MKSFFGFENAVEKLAMKQYSLNIKKVWIHAYIIFKMKYLNHTIFNNNCTNHSDPQQLCLKNNEISKFLFTVIQFVGAFSE